MPVTPKALHAHQNVNKQPDETKKLLLEIVDQQKEILAALEKLAAK
jgi:hypothetical protein